MVKIRLGVWRDNVTKRANVASTGNSADVWPDFVETAHFARTLTVGEGDLSLISGREKVADQSPLFGQNAWRALIGVRQGQNVQICPALIGANRRRRQK